MAYLGWIRRLLIELTAVGCSRSCKQVGWPCQCRSWWAEWRVDGRVTARDVAAAIVDAGVVAVWWRDHLAVVHDWRGWIAWRRGCGKWLRVCGIVLARIGWMMWRVGVVHEWIGWQVAVDVWIGWVGKCRVKLLMLLVVGHPGWAKYVNRNRSIRDLFFIVRLLLPARLLF